MADDLLLAPTAVDDRQSNGISLDGLSSLLNRSTQDGQDTTPMFAAQDSPRSRSGQSPNQFVSQSAVREFQVQVADYSAQYGRAGSAVIRTVTKSGTQRFHATGLFFDRDNSWLSRVPGVQLYLPQPDGVLVAQSLPSDYRLQGAITAAGVVPQSFRWPMLQSWRNRVVWRVTYDQQDRNFPALSTITNDPQAALSQALPSDSTGFNPTGQTCAALDTGLLKSTGSETVNQLYGTQGACFLNLYGSTIYPNYALASAAYNNALAYVYSLLGTAPRRSTIVSVLPRLDINLTTKQKLAIAWNAVREQAPNGGSSQPFVDAAVTSLGSDHLALDDVSARLASLVTTHSSNEAHLGFAHDSESEYAHAPLAQEPHTAFGGTAAPGVRIRGTLLLGTPPQLPRATFPRENRWQLGDTVAIAHGGHSLHIGGDWIHTSDAVAALQAAAGDYRYNSMQDFLIDVASSAATTHSENCGGLCYSTYEQGFGQPGLSFGGNLFAAFAQDDFRASPYLTLNLGLRYDYQQLPSPQLPNPLLPATEHFAADRRDIAPRLGFAWTIPSATRTVVRGGYGLFYATSTGTMLYHALINTGILTGTASSAELGQSRYDFATASASSNANSPLYPSTLLVMPTGAGGPDTVPIGLTVTALAGNFRRPLVQQASLGLEEEFTPRTSVAATGLLSLARHLPVAVDENLYPPGSNGVSGDALPSTVAYQFTGGGPLSGQTATVPFYAERVDACSGTNGTTPCFGKINTIESRANATYAAFALTLRHTATRQLDLRVHYAWSHAMDFGELDTGASRNQVLSPHDFQLERARSTLDRASRLTLAAIWRSQLQHGPQWTQQLLGGWIVSPSLLVSSGQPFSATVVGTAPAQENLIGSQQLKPASSGYLGAGGADYLLPLGRNHYRQPLTENADLRVAHRVPTGVERLRVQASVEAFNLFNHRNLIEASTIAYRIGSGQAGLGGSAANPAIATWQPDFGSPVTANSSNLFVPRQLQISLRADF